MAHTFTNLLSHITFSTKDRASLIDTDLKPRLLGYMNGIVQETGGKVFSINAVPDHVHMLVNLPPTLAMSDVLRVVKTNSSRWIHETWKSRSEFKWQAGYGAFSVSRSNVPSVARYIEKQEAHHRKVTFQEEFIKLLEKHQIGYDPRYIWE